MTTRYLQSMFSIRKRRGAGWLVVLLLVSLVVTVPAAAAGTTSVSLTPTETTADAGERVAVDVVVDEASGGVGAWEVRLNLSDGGVADIVDVTLHGGPGLQTVDIAEDNNSVYFDAALANTDDTGPVTIATVTVELTAEGQTTLVPTIDALGDEEGDRYTVTETTGTTIATGESVTATPTPTATTATPNTPTPTPTDTDEDSSGVVGGDQTDAGTVVTEQTATPTEPTATPTDDPGTRTVGGTTQSASPDERSASPTGYSETTDPPTEAGSGISAPGFTVVASLAALLLTVVLLGRR